MLRFTWDSTKAIANERKHGVSFEEARTAFDDENGRLMYDPDHSEAEDRFVLLGFSSNLRLLVVCHAHTNGERPIRIISARKATKREAEQYRGFL